MAWCVTKEPSPTRYGYDHFGNFNKKGCGIMCIEIEIEGKWYDSVASIRNILPVLVKDDFYDTIDEESCLCPIDVEKTAKENGYSCEQVGAMEYQFVCMVMRTH
jgi:hypothetical protein